MPGVHQFGCNRGKTHCANSLALDYAPNAAAAHTYRLSEACEYGLRVLAEALRSTHALCADQDDERTDFTAWEAAPLFRVFGEHLANLVASVEFAAVPEPTRLAPREVPAND